MKIRKKSKRINSDQEEPAKVFSIRLTFKQARIAKLIGCGNFSRGVRLALDKIASVQDFMKSAYYILRRKDKD